MKKRIKINWVYVVLLIATITSACRNENKQNSKDSTMAVRDSTIIDREYTLEASMLGYFASDGSRNPTLLANKGDRVRIIITNKKP